MKRDVKGRSGRKKVKEERLKGGHPREPPEQLPRLSPSGVRPQSWPRATSAPGLPLQITARTIPAAVCPPLCFEDAKRNRRGRHLLGGARNVGFLG